jgi:hypothetical protein
VRVREGELPESPGSARGVSSVQYEEGGGDGYGKWRQSGVAVDYCIMRLRGIFTSKYVSLVM